MTEIGGTRNTRIRNCVLMIRSMRPYAGEMVMTVFSSILKHFSTIGASAIGAYMVALAMQGQLSARFRSLFIWLVALILFRGITYYSEMWFGHNVAYKVLKDFRVQVFEQIDRISPAFFLKNHSGQIASTLMSDIELLEWFLAHTFGTYIVAFVVTLLILVMLAYIHLSLALLMLLFVVLAFLTPIIKRKKADQQGQLVREQLANANTVTIEGIQGLKEIVTLNFLEKYKAKSHREMQNLYNLQLEYSRRQGDESMTLQLLIGFFSVSIMGVAAYLVSTQKVDFNFYTIIVMLSALLFNPISEVCLFSRNLGNVFAAADRVQSILNMEPEVDDTGAFSDIEHISHDVSFKNVSFRYDKKLDDVLHNVSFDIKPGETVALVGPSGAGKSTCVNLLLRYWDVGDGEILIGGKNIKEFSLNALHDISSAVLQDVYLFNISIKENIRLGLPTATDEQVIEAAKGAFAHDFIMGLPNGYDTVTGERGVQLSGGQRQRIAIARAVLKNSPILILDEAVSSLDTENERFIQKTLKEQSTNRTTLVVAHRLSTIMSADRLVVINEGNVVQVGSHLELIDQDGFYRELVQSQFSKNEMAVLT